MQELPNAGAVPVLACLGSQYAGWRIKVDAGRPATLLSHRPQRYLHLGQLQEMFFYVPKGTKEVQYFWSGGPHKVLGPDHKPIMDVQTSDDIVSVAEHFRTYLTTRDWQTVENPAP